jgi:hypothetical protein
MTMNTLVAAPTKIGGIFWPKAPIAAPQLLSFDHQVFSLFAGEDGVMHSVPAGIAANRRLSAPPVPD